MVDKTVIVTLPAGKTVFDIDYLGLWCKQANADFGHVIIPPRPELNIPPSLDDFGMVSWKGCILGLIH